MIADSSQTEIKSARRVLDLLLLFAEKRQALTVGEVVEGLDCPQSSASVLLRSLTRMAYLDYDRVSRRYKPTLRVALLGGWVHDELFSDTSLSGLVDQLHRQSGNAVIVGMQNDSFVQYIHLAQSPHPELSWYIKPGALRPLCRTAVGKVLLSRKQDVEVLSLVRRINAEERDSSKRVGAGGLLAELDHIRQQGFAISEGVVNPRAGVVAVELPTPASQPPMAIGIGAPIPVLKAQRDRFLSLMTDALRRYQIKAKADPT